jgi:hypothetical protein
MFGFFALWVWLKGGFEPKVPDAAVGSNGG